uniref:Uncharacterized protein n=1 Tax=Triticum urartu TaxID=4572 RepID=A0A8R7V798_TRIUA
MTSLPWWKTSMPRRWIDCICVSSKLGTTMEGGPGLHAAVAVGLKAKHGHGRSAATGSWWRAGRRLGPRTGSRQGPGVSASHRKRQGRQRA